jgi:hypothetical protein
MTPQNPLNTFQLEVWQGKDWKPEFIAYSNEDGTQLANLTSCSMELKLRTPEDARNVKLTVTPSLGGSAGTVTWTVLGTVTATWSVGTVLTGVLFLTDAGGRLHALCNIVATVYQP